MESHNTAAATMSSKGYRPPPSKNSSSRRPFRTFSSRTCFCSVRSWTSRTNQLTWTRALMSSCSSGNIFVILRFTMMHLFNCCIAMISFSFPPLYVCLKPRCLCVPSENSPRLCKACFHSLTYLLGFSPLLSVDIRNLRELIYFGYQAA